MKKKLFLRHPTKILIVGSALAIGLLSTGYSVWNNVKINDSWATQRIVYDVDFVYLSNEVITFKGLERNSKLELFKFNDERFVSSWRVANSNTNYSGVVSIETLYNADTAKQSSSTNSITTYKLTLYETLISIAEGFFKVEVNSGINTKSNNASLTLNYSYVTPLIDNFNLFNVNPTYEGLTLDHFTIGGTTYSLNDVLHLKSGGAHASLLSNSTLTLVAYFK